MDLEKDLVWLRLFTSCTDLFRDGLYTSPHFKSPLYLTRGFLRIVKYRVGSWPHLKVTSIDFVRNVPTPIDCAAVGDGRCDDGDWTVGIRGGYELCSPFHITWIHPIVVFDNIDNIINQVICTDCNIRKAPGLPKQFCLDDMTP